MILIYADHLTGRLQYIVSTLFGNHALLTDSKPVFLGFSGKKILYAEEKGLVEEKERAHGKEDILWIRPYGLLRENSIRDQHPVCFEWKGWKVFFKTEGDIPFDIFSASFYLISRYEEYLSYEPDLYGRYPFQHSLAYKENFLQLPLVNLWMTALKLELPTRFTFLPTYDIDIAYNYLHQPVWRNVAGFYRALLKADLEGVLERGNVFSGRQKDPFDVYDWLDALHEATRLEPVYFFLMAAKRKGVDKNMSPRTKAMKRLIRRHADKYVTGIHPSWQSGVPAPGPVTQAAVLKKEIRLLKKIIGRDILASRQHYISMQLPGTYRRLLQAGIRQEYSMGYGSMNGFRASYTLPFYWYDLPAEEVTDLMVYPYCYMDANAYFEQKATVQEAAAELRQFHDIVRQVNGQLITIFHNHFLTTQPQWVNWRNLYEQFLRTNFC